MSLPKTVNLTVKKTNARRCFKSEYPKKYMPQKRRAQRLQGPNKSVFGQSYDGDTTSSEIMLNVSGDNVITFKTAYCPKQGLGGPAKIVSTSMPIRALQRAIVFASGVESKI